jgi:long-chain acyl-CoA synthetase
VTPVTEPKVPTIRAREEAVMATLWDEKALVLSTGRSIDPGPIEARIRRCPLIEHTCIIGHRLPYLVALIVLAPHANRTDPSHPPEIRSWIDYINADLPDSARIHAYAQLREPWPACSKFRTPHGQLNRRNIEAHYAPLIDHLYAQPDGVPPVSR